MKISNLWLTACILLQDTTALPHLFKRDADFDSVRLLSHLDRPHTQLKQDSSQKYFQDSSFAAHHYDGRFGNHELKPKDKHLGLVALVQSYLISMNDLGVPTWLMHETLLSWYSNRKLRPGQSRVDVMISRQSIQFLADSYNMTIYNHKSERLRRSRNYLLEVNPFYNESRIDEADARWIDTYTGLYINLETFWHAGKGAVDDQTTDIDRSLTYALQETTFEGVPARIPAHHTAMLMEEYGDEALLPLQND